MHSESILGFVVGAVHVLCSSGGPTLVRLLSWLAGQIWATSRSLTAYALHGAVGATHLGRAEDGGRLKVPVLVLLPGVDDQGHVAAAAGGKLPEGPDDVVLDGEPGVT